MTKVAYYCLAVLVVALLGSCSRSAPGDANAEFATRTPSANDQTVAISQAAVRGASDQDFLARAPRVAAARMRRLAARASATAAGILPDPMLDVLYMRMPMDSEYGAGGMIMLEQTFPRWGERDGMRAMAAADLAMADADLAMVRGEILSRLTMYQAQARGAQAKANAYSENAKRAENFAELIAKSAAATGGARLAEVLALHSRAQAMEVAAHEAQIAATDALGRGRALLGLSVTATVPDPGSPAAALIDLTRNPRLRLAQAAALQAQAQFAIAASRSRPEVGVRAGWQREGRDAFDEYRVGVSIAIPVHPSAWRGPEEAALRRHDAAQLDAAGVNAEAEELLARVSRAQEQALRARTVADDTKKRLGLELENVSSGVATAEPGSIAMVFERLDMLADTEVMAAMAEAEAAMAGAELWMLMPIPDAVAERP